jgi:hypothetical protein
LTNGTIKYITLPTPLKNSPMITKVRLGINGLVEVASNRVTDIMAIIIQYTLQHHISRNEDTKENIEEKKEHNMFKFSKPGGGGGGRSIENNSTT